MSSLPRLAADVETRRQEALSRVEQAEKALAEPFKHADALKAAQANSARIDQLMADAAKPEEHAQPEPGEIDPRLEKMQRLMSASFPQQSASQGAAAVATATRQRSADYRRQDSDYGR